MINYRDLEALAKSQGRKHVWGRHMIPGAPLQWIWQHPDQGFQEQPYGHYPNALKKYIGGWDGTNETRDYFEQLTLELRKACPKLKKPILMVPVGDVMYELDQRIWRFRR